MLKNLIAVLSVVLLLASCKTIDTQNRFDTEDQSAKQQTEENKDTKDFVTENQPQTEQKFEVVDNAAAAQTMNQKAQEEVEEVEVPDRIFFAVDKSDLSADATKVLDTQTEWLQSDPAIKIVIEGHCDERGTREYNIALGERRALSVKKYFTSKGINGSRIKVISYGKERPAFVGSSEDIWSKNRRAVTVIDK